MPTKTTQKKRRINLSPSEEDMKFIEFLAKRDNVPIARKTIDLVKNALEFEEDEYIIKLSEERVKNDTGERLSLEEIKKEFQI